MEPDSNVVDALYEAAAVPELWPEALSRLCQVAGAWGSGLLTFDPQQRMRFISTANYADVFHDFAANSDRYDNQRPKRALATGYTGFLHDLEIFTQAELDVDPVYRDFIYPRGVRWTAGVVVPVPTSDIMVFDLARQAEPFQRSDMERLDLYRPHLARSALLAHRLGLRAARAATDALEILGLPAAVIGNDRRVISANGLFDGLAPRVATGAFNRIYLQSTLPDAMLKTALTDPHLNSVRSIPLPATETIPAILVHLVPIRHSAHDVFARGEVLALFTLVTTPSAPLTEVLTGLFDLTPAEARVARGIASGTAIEVLAKSNSVSRETVRSQLKSLMMKTGTTRQVELAVLLSGLRPI